MGHPARGQVPGRSKVCHVPVPWQVKFPRTSSSRSTRLLATTVASNHDLQKRRIPRLSSRKAESGDAYILTVLNGSPVEIATIPCVSPQESSFFLRHPSYIISSSITNPTDTPFPYPMNPPNPKSIRYPAIPL